MFGVIFELFHIVGQCSACSPKGKTWANNEGESDIPGNVPCLFHVAGNGASRHFQTDFRHRFFKLTPVFSLLYSGKVRTDHLDAEGIEDPSFRRFHCRIKGRLSAYCGKHRVGSLFCHNLFYNIRRYRFYVGAMGHVWVGHYGCGV